MTFEQVRSGRSAATRRPADYLDGQAERYCHKCGEWWPETEEFFYRYPKNKALFRSPCIACIQEKKAQTNAARTCCVKGCTNARHNGTHRCWEHRYYLVDRAKAVKR